jgi:hypothetical protein
VNTFASHVAFIVSVPVLRTSDELERNSVAERSARVYVTLQALTGTQSALTAVFVLGARYHLMVWRVFAPKFVFDSALMVCVDLVSLMMMRAVARTSTNTTVKDE